MILILIIFSFVLILLLKNKSLALLLILIQLFSVIGTFFLGRDMEIESIGNLGWVFLMIILLLLIILPWKNFYGIKKIEAFDKNKLKNITRFLIIINSFVFIVFSITTITVMTLVTDINEFKYSEGVSMQFYYKMLPFPTVFFNISILVYYFSFFLIPLHFYYLSEKKYFLSLVCFVLSLNIILYGLSFFSRAVVVQYLMLYISMLYISYSTIPLRAKKVMRNLFIVFGTISFFYFIYISQKRFDDDRNASKAYSQTIPVTAITQNPVIYSYFDYTSQAFYNGYEVLNLYNGEGFRGTLTLESLLSLVSDSKQTYNRVKYKQKLWPYQYSYSFNGFPAYSVYDFGIVGSLLFGVLFYFIVNKLRPRKNVIRLKELFLIVLLVQIPLMSIFYSQMGGILIALIFWIPLNIYLKFTFKK